MSAGGGSVAVVIAPAPRPAPPPRPPAVEAKKHPAAAASSSPTTSGDERDDELRKVASPGWALPVLICVWLLNITLAAAASYALINWSAFTWIVGSAAWASGLEIICILCIVYLLCGGCCLLGCESRVRDSYLQMHNHSHCRLLSTLAIPFLIGCVFAALAILALAPLSATNQYVQMHSAEVFAKADTDGDGAITILEFYMYTASLSSMAIEAKSSTFSATVKSLFASMDSNSDGYLTKDDMYEGLLNALGPARLKFGICSGVIAIIAWTFAAIYSCWYARLLRDKLESEADVLPEVEFADRDDFDDDGVGAVAHKREKSALLSQQAQQHHVDDEPSEGEDDEEEGGAAGAEVASPRSDDDDDDEEVNLPDDDAASD